MSLQYCHKLPDVLKRSSLYSIKLYIGITISIYSALSACVLFILLIQLVNGAPFLNINFLFLFVGAAAAVVVLSTFVFPLTSIYASL